MKTKNSNIIISILIAVLVIILAGLLIAWMTGLFKSKKENLNSGTEKINDAFGSMADFDMDVYNGATIDGDTLINLIEEIVYKNEDFSVAIQTLANQREATPVTVYYNRSLTAANGINTSGTVTVLNQTNVSDNNYITPSTNFLGETLRNTNNEITGILFIQQK